MHLLTTKRIAFLNPTYCMRKGLMLIFLLGSVLAGCGSGSENESYLHADSPEQEHEEYCYTYDPEEIIDFLLDSGCGMSYGMENCILNPGEEPVARWIEAPVLRMTEGTTEDERKLTREVIASINEALPDEYDIFIGEDVEDFPGPHTPFLDPMEEERIPIGEIHLGFVPNIKGAYGTAARGLAERDGVIILEKGRVEISRAMRREPALDCDLTVGQVIAHEVMHTLNFLHVTDRWLHTSVMTPSLWACEGNGIPGYLGSMDRDAIRALYTMEPGDGLEDFMPGDDACFEN